MDASPFFRRLLALLLVMLACGSEPALAAGDVPLAIKGYDVVAYFSLEEGARPVPGKPEYEYEWDEQLYRFSSAENRAKFKKKPGKYLPRFGNNCAGALSFGLALPANPDIWLVRDGKLLLFGSPDSREFFKNDPKPMNAGAERNARRLQKNQLTVMEVIPPDDGLRQAMADVLNQCRDPHTQVICHAIIWGMKVAGYVRDHAELAKEGATEP